MNTNSIDSSSPSQSPHESPNQERRSLLRRSNSSGSLRLSSQSRKITRAESKKELPTPQNYHSLYQNQAALVSSSYPPMHVGSEYILDGGSLQTLTKEFRSKFQKATLAEQANYLALFLSAIQQKRSSEGNDNDNNQSRLERLWNSSGIQHVENALKDYRSCSSSFLKNFSEEDVSVQRDHLPSLPIDIVAKFLEQIPNDCLCYYIDSLERRLHQLLSTLESNTLTRFVQNVPLSWELFEAMMKLDPSNLLASGLKDRLEKELFDFLIQYHQLMKPEEIYAFIRPTIAKKPLDSFYPKVALLPISVSNIYLRGYHEKLVQFQGQLPIEHLAHYLVSLGATQVIQEITDFSPQVQDATYKLLSGNQN